MLGANDYAMQTSRAAFSVRPSLTSVHGDLHGHGVTKALTTSMRAIP